MIEQWICDEQQAIDKWEAIEWARKILERTDIVYLDTETTGLHNAYPVEIAVLSRHGSPLLNTLVKPPVPCEEGAARVHGITEEMLDNAPTFPEIYPQLEKVLRDRTVIIYNAAFDCGILRNCCNYYSLPQLKFMPQCAMEWYAQYVGDWHRYYGNYKWQKLPHAGHRAAGDAWACREVVKKMAIPPFCHVEYSRIFPPVQLFCQWKEFAQVVVNWKKPSDRYYGKHFSLHLSLPVFKWERRASFGERGFFPQTSRQKPYASKTQSNDDIPF